MITSKPTEGAPPEEEWQKEAEAYANNEVGNPLPQWSNHRKLYWAFCKNAYFAAARKYTQHYTPGEEELKRLADAWEDGWTVADNYHVHGDNYSKKHHKATYLKSFIGEGTETPLRKLERENGFLKMRILELEKAVRDLQQLNTTSLPPLKVGK